jgi:hypothetical protein
MGDKAAPAVGLTPGQTVFLVATLVSVTPREDGIAAAVTARLPVRWSGAGYQQLTVPIEAVALP